MSKEPILRVVTKIQWINGERVIDIPEEFGLDTEDVTLTYDGERIVITPRELDTSLLEREPSDV